MGSVRAVLAVLLFAGTAAMPAFAQNLFMPAPFRDPAVTENQELPGAGESVPPRQPLVQPLDRAPLPRSRPRMPYPAADAAATPTAAPALASARPALAEPATTGRGQPSSQLPPLPAGAGGQIRIINNTAVGVATMSLIPKGPAGPHALVANLAPFNVTSASLPAGRGCVFAVQGTFADGSPLAIDNIDLCRDPLINITVW
jgi:hypothetical protein